MLFLSLMALLPVVIQWMAVQASAPPFPATVEIDLLFPRNTTYSPSILFPLIFAFQNAPLAPSLDPGFDLQLWDITASNGLNTTSYSPSLDLSLTNFSLTDPTYVYTFLTNLKPANYRLVWDFGASNCSLEGGAFTYGGGFRDNSVEFTIQEGAQAMMPDLVTATNSAGCDGIGHFAFNLTGTLDIAIPAQYDNRNTCAVFDEEQPLVQGNPCAVQISSATASSISAAITATACKAVNPVVSCTTTPKKSDAASGIRRRDGGFTGKAVLGGLVAAFV
ncbi:hypothetical protein N431DRAFT_367431 [Stipitochalara longipes BDJ]|nr:hypothetical protein N431DRAFT_367431 [Stipitochalara longipes BDJ]